MTGRRFAIVVGDYCDREAGFVSLTYHTKQLAFAFGLRLLLALKHDIPIRAPDAKQDLLPVPPLTFSNITSELWTR